PRLEFPLFHGLDRGLIEAERQSLEHLHVAHGAALVDDALDDDDAGDARLAGHFRILRLDAGQRHRRLDVAADAQRRLLLRRRRLGVGDDAADDAADDTADHAALDAAFNTADDAGVRRLRR